MPRCLRRGCPLFGEIGFVSKKWSLLILRSLSHDKKRFVDLSRELKNITPRILAQRLEEMESIEIISKKRFSEAPSRVEYFLTAKGKKLARCYMQDSQ
ncbi:MAG: helix-turn-helix domain-containing protein [Candidatus Aenigmatarchaeota archaeon]